MKVIKVFGLIYLLCLSAFAQADNYALEGKVTDSAGKAVSGAEVTIRSETDPQYDKITITDAEGRYVFNPIPGGVYLVAASYIFNNELKRSLPIRTTVKLASSPTVVDLMIKVFAGVRETVTISADAEQPSEQVSKSVNIIDRQEMRDRADFTLVDTLRTIPGFRVQQLGGFGKTASIKTRGLRNQDTALLIDGIRFRDAASITGDATPFLSDFTLTSINRIEVLRGSGSSLYGTNAIGGTVDFQTPTPTRGLHGQISGAAGGFGLGRFRGNLSYGGEKFGISGGISRTAYTKGIDGEDNASNTNFQSRVEINPTDRTNVSARFFVSDARVRLNSSPDTLGTPPPTNTSIINGVPGVNFEPDVNDPDDIQESKFFNGQIVLTQVINPSLLFQAYYSGLKTSRENVTGPLGVGFQSGSLNIFDGLIQTANANLQWAPNGTNRLTAGYEFESEKFVNDSASEFGSPLSTNARQSSNTIYVQHLVGFLDGRLQLAGGFRTQFFDLEKPTFSATSPLENLALGNPPTSYTFDGSASYFFRSTGTKFRGHVGNGYRAPSLYERFSSFFGFAHPDQLFLAGAPDLESERSVAFDTGVEQNLFDNRLHLTGTYFYTHLKDAIGYGSLPQPDRFGRLNSETFGGYLNTGSLISRGAEFSARIRPLDSTDIFSSYTFTNSDQGSPQVSGSGILTSLGVPSHQFTAVVTQRIKQFWVSFDFVGTSSHLAPIFSSSTFSGYVYRFGGSRRADFTAGYTFPIRDDKLNLRLFGTIENLFDYDYFENGFRTVGRNGRIGLSFAF